jgi:hypothetical protein
MKRLLFIGLSAGLIALSLSACDPRFTYESNLSPREIQSLVGTWEGQSSLSFGDKECPTHYLWTLRVSNGNVDGSLVDKETPNAPRTRFTTFLDYNGTFSALVRPRGQDTTVIGAFQRDLFVGEAKGQCKYILRLRRVASS